MATVLISTTFIERVYDVIRKMRNAEVQSIGEQPKAVLSPESPEVINMIWGSHAHLRTQIPQTWTRKHDYLSAMYDTKIPVPNTERTYTFTFSINSSTNEFILPNTDEYRPRFNVSDDIEDAQIKAVCAYFTQLAEAEARWETVRNKVTTFFNSCKSLNEAVKLWPDCKVYVHPDDIKRLETKVERYGNKDSEAAKTLATINTDELMGAAVLARLSGAA